MAASPIVRPADNFQQATTVDELTAVCRHTFGTQTQVFPACELGSGLFNSTAGFWGGVRPFPPDDPATQFCQLAYRGMYTVQMLLEATRFG